MRSELEKVLTCETLSDYNDGTAYEFLRDHGQALVEAVQDAERMDELELSQRADVYWHENGDQELAGYEWGTGGQYATARGALDASIAARSKTVDGGGA